MFTRQYFEKHSEAYTVNIPPSSYKMAFCDLSYLTETWFLLNKTMSYC